MSFIKYISGAFVAFTMLVSSSQIAMAGTTTLVCSTTDDWVKSGSPITIDLNEAAGTATVNYPADQSAARSFGPFPATFDSRNITFDGSNNNGGQTWMFYFHYTLDRMTGVFLNYQSLKAPWNQAAPGDKLIYHYTCEAGKARF